MSDAVSDDVELTDDQIRRAEAHRGFVREMHDRLNRTYGIGGSVVLVAFVALCVAAVLTGWWNRLTLWVPGLTGVLIVLYVARGRIYARRDRMRQQVIDYCEANELSVDTLLTYYEADATYPFFLTIFEDPADQLADETAGTNR